MSPDAGAGLRVGYVVKRFPRESETFIAQEILELERRGVHVVVLQLHENDREAEHAWLRELRAEVVACRAGASSETWNWLRARAAEGTPERRRDVRAAVTWALDLEKGLRDLGQAVALARAAREREIGHLHAHFANRPAGVALLAHGLAGLPFSFTAHAKDIYAAGPGEATWKRLVCRASFVATVSEANRRHILERVGDASADAVRCLYNGVDLEAIRPLPSEERAGDDAFELVAVARHVPKKGLDVLVAAAGELRDRGVSFRCSLVGDGPERDALVALRDRLSLQDRVAFEGSLPHEAVVERIRRADALALPCVVAEDGDRDALPTVLLEAMAAGVACVSTPVGGIPEIVSDGETGSIVPTGDAKALADALERLACDRPLARQMGRAGRARAERCFDRRRNVAVLHEWLAASSGRTA